MYNTETLYKARNSVIKFFDDYSSIISEAKHKTYHGEGMKLLTFKQILQRLPIALALIKAGNTSENLLNRIRQLIYFLCRAIKLLKNYITI